MTFAERKSSTPFTMLEFGKGVGRLFANRVGRFTVSDSVSGRDRNTL